MFYYVQFNTASALTSFNQIYILPNKVHFWFFFSALTLNYFVCEVQ